MQKLQSYLSKQLMALLPLISASIIFFFVVLTPCFSMHIQVPSVHAQEADRSRLDNEIKSSSPTLPRKLRVLIVHHNQFNDNDGKGQVYGTQPKADKSEGRKKEWREASKFMTMDYRPVRRRRPIHNKSLPLSP